MATSSKSSRLGDPNDFFVRMLKAAFPDAVPEYKFHPKRRWRLDWFLPEIKVGIEIEGGIWNKGRHTRPSGFIKDIEKYNTAALMGIKIYRINHDDLRSVSKIISHFENIKNYTAIVQ